MSANKAKGTKWETDLVRFFRDQGIPARRVAQEGFNDSGDLHGLSPFVGQAKNYKSWEEAIRLGLDGAEKQKVNAGEPFGVAFVKRVRKGVGQGYAVMTVQTFADLLLRLYRAEDGIQRE
ncbi:holliday junction resolvase [Arthrobacter phage Cassia]|uniref:Holliday junction resolvase n=1 Tax=Arthrobacter phage Cassia TaxID=2927275 RepID=A0AAF0GJV2_9CAUD|nr:holliday junction resolvase [Arthrobacter phage Cassia]